MLLELYLNKDLYHVPKDLPDSKLEQDIFSVKNAVHIKFYNSDFFNRILQ